MAPTEFTYDKDEYCSRTDHRQQTAGAPRHPRWDYWKRYAHEEFERVSNRLRYCGWMDKAWTVMLYRCGLIELDTARKLLTVLADADHEKGWGGEPWIRDKLGGDEDTASAVNLGRTLQEPMARMQLREKVLDVVDRLLDTMSIILAKAEENADAMMAGQSHFSHAQPTTYGAYLIAVHDGLERALSQVELAYRFTNMNSGGCGACSGTGWPVDRQLVTDLLGFDNLIVPAYDCEGSQDEIPQILFALSSIALTLGRTSMDHEIWGLEEIGNISVKGPWLGISSFMPQKAHTGGIFENIRMPCNDVLGQMMTCVTTFKGEAIQDVLPVYQSPPYALRGCCITEHALGLFGEVLPDVIVHRDRMREIVRNGYSGAPDLAIKMIRDLGYGARQAHRICCNFVRLARERGIKPYDTTGELLDEAARITSEPEPHLSTADVQYAMGLEHFFERPQNHGDPRPEETVRLVELRRQRHAEHRQRQQDRRDRLARADERLAAEIADILGE